MAASQPGWFNFFALTNLSDLADGYRLFTYAPGTTTQKVAYTDAAGSISHTYTSDGMGGLYIALDARGELPAPLFLSSGGYDLTLKTAAGATVWTRRAYGQDDVAITLDAALRADLASTADAAKGDALIGVKSPLTGAVARTQHGKNTDVVSVKDFGAVGDGIADDTVAIQAAIDALPQFGAVGWRPCILYFPMPSNKYLVTGTLSVKRHQGLIIKGEGCQIEGNFAGIILDMGDTGGANDLLRVHVEYLTVVQLSTAVNSGAVRARHLYECSFHGCYFYGGKIAYELDGNANSHTACTFRNGVNSNVKTGAQSNNEINHFLGCSSELSAGYGYDLSVASGVGGYTVIQGGYCEANATGNVFITNTQKTIVDSVYFNLQNNASAIVLGGSVGATYPPSVIVQNCRVLGSSSGTPKFIEELSDTSINCQYGNNTLEADACSMYASAGKSVNRDRVGAMTYIQNASAFSGGPPPTGWTLVGAGPAAGVANTTSPYGGEGAVQITAASYIHQTVTFPANALLRVSAWSYTTGADATLQLWNTAISAQFTGASAAVTTGLQTKLEFYVSPAARSSAVSGKLLLRNLTGTGSAYFGNLEIEDMTN